MNALNRSIFALALLAAAGSVFSQTVAHGTAAMAGTIGQTQAAPMKMDGMKMAKDANSADTMPTMKAMPMRAAAMSRSGVDNAIFEIRRMMGR